MRLAPMASKTRFGEIRHFGTTSKPFGHFCKVFIKYLAKCKAYFDNFVMLLEKF